MAKKNWIKGAVKSPGAFTLKAQRRKMTVAKFREYVLSHKDEFDATTIRQANLAKTFSKMKH